MDCDKDAAITPAYNLKRSGYQSLELWTNMTSLRCPTLWPYVTSLYTKVMVVISPRRGSPNLSSQDENSKVFQSNHNTMTKHYSDFTTQLIGLKVYSHLAKVERKRKRSKNKQRRSKNKRQISKKFSFSLSLPLFLGVNRPYYNREAIPKRFRST